jgi:hypothetical protein
LRPDSWTDQLLAARLVAQCLPLAGSRAGAWRARMRSYVRRAVDHCPDDAPTQNNLAWDLVTAPEQEMWSPAHAVRLARRAVQGGKGGHWNTLGVASYRNGELAAAVAALEESMRERQGGDPYDWLFLALVYHRRGDGKVARQWYDRSLRWMKTHGEGDEEMRRFHAEARAALAPKGR